MRNYYPLINSMGSGAAAIDADAQAFITAAAITDSTQQTAINTLVTDLKGYGIWTKMKAIYPMVGGSASTHKWNLKDPRDLDAAYRLQFVNGWTHSSTGAKPNGTDAYASTFLTPDNVFSSNSEHFSYYSRNNIQSGIDMGAYSFSNSSNQSLAARATDNNCYASMGDSPSPIITNLDSTGMYIVNRNTLLYTDCFKNGTKIINAIQGFGKPQIPFYLGALNFNSVASYLSARESAFSSIGDGLSDTEAANLTTAVQAFNTTLTRNI